MKSLSFFRNRAVWLVVLACTLVAGVVAQETTGGLQGTVKDPSGALVSGAEVVLTSPVLIGNKSLSTDGSGYYRFTNLPPGAYTLTVTAKGFSELKRGGVTIEVGHLPSLDLALVVGAAGTTVEVTGEAPEIDVTTTRTLTNITSDVINDVPHGRSFQSVIQFAPSARNEPLMGNNTGSNGTGGNAPGSTTNGSDHGFSVAGGSDAENSYLVEGQETANLIGGYSHTNVPFDFIEEVQIKSSGIEAEHGGALGGVVNVIMKKGTNQYHGALFAQFGNQALDGSPNAYSRYDPQGGLSRPNGTFYLDAVSQNYQPVRPKSSDVFPGFSFGGPILKDRVFGFVAFNPEWTDLERKVVYGPSKSDVVPFSRNTQTYYTTARVDASVTQKIRVFASWLYQYQRQNGVNLPSSDSTVGLQNGSTGCFGSATDPVTNPCVPGSPQSVFAHKLGYTAPNVTANFGADFSLTPRLVFTTRLGIYFENYHDGGYSTGGTLNGFNQSGIVGSANAVLASPHCAMVPTDPACNLPTSLQQSNGAYSDGFSPNFTTRNANKAIQYDADLAWFRSGWGGTHNFKFGYQLNRLKNDILQSYNEPFVLYSPGINGGYSPLSGNGILTCNDPTKVTWTSSSQFGCQGLYGYLNVYDFGTGGKVTSFNHGLFAQDAWTIGHGITLNYGVRFDKEYLPASSGAALKSNPIDFSWADKVAPRIGAAWDVFRDGRMKVFGSYGKFFDIMKLNVAISSFGGQYWNQCFYTLDAGFDITQITPAANAAKRYCVGLSPTDTTNPATFKGGGTPAGLTFIENINNRTFPTTCSTCSLTSTGVTPGLKPYSQHESVFGVDYQIRKNLAFEARWDRRRLDHAIEDSSIINNGNETFVIGNPGQGSEKTFNSFYNFLYGTPPPPCSGAGCAQPGMFPAARSYDGLELRLNKTNSQHWFGMFSYTYSKLRGNYTGLTTSDISDGQSGGRSSPNNSRAFDEPYFQWNANGGSSSGLLPTDRPHTLKGYAYYELGFKKKYTTDLGIFQVLYSGSPITSYIDVGAGGGGWAVQAWGRGKFVDAHQDPTTGLITLGAPRVQRTPWYTQSDFNLQQNVKIGERMGLSFSATFNNLLNQRAVTAYNADLTSLNVGNQYITLNSTTSTPCTAVASFHGTCYIGDGVPFYAAAERPYDVAAQLNNFKGRGYSAALNSAYKTPVYYQLARSIRFGVKFTF